MQDASQVQWDPIVIDYHLPWESRLLILYLVVVVAMALMKSASILRTLYFSKRGPLQMRDDFLFAWERCSNKVRSIKRTVFVTLLWTAFAVATLLTENFKILMEHKAFGPAAFVGTTVEAVTLLTFSILVCAVLFSISASYEGVLLRRRELWNRARSTMEGQRSKG
jgi:hypothetical protein